MIALLASLALAQTSGGEVPQLNAQLFRPSIDATKTLWTNDTFLSRTGYATAKVMASYAKDPAVYVTEDGEVTKLVSDVVATNLLAGITAGPVRFGLDVPVYLRTVGGATGGETGIGDLTIDLRGTFLDRTKAPVGIGVAVRGDLPTSSVQAPLGYSGFAWEAEGILDAELGKTLLALNVGNRGVPEVQLENFTANDQLFVRGGVGYGEVEGAGVSLDVGGHATYASIGNADANPVEALLGGWVTVAEAVKVRGGAGTGLTGGLGAPQLRALLAVAYEPPRDRDADGDGITDRIDDCPDVPEDIDMVADSDGCPDPTRVIVKVVSRNGVSIAGATWSLGKAKGYSGEGTELQGGEYSLSVAAEGFQGVQTTVNIPDGATHDVIYKLDANPGALTVVAVDSIGRIIGNASWRPLLDDTTRPVSGGDSMLLRAGDYRVRVEADGYRAVEQAAVVRAGQPTDVEVVLETSRVQVTRERIDISESIYFETGKSVIKAESFGLLDEIASVILDHPELLKVRIEGHTDSRGSAGANKSLSDKRASAVRDYLMGKGVDGGRLDSEGFGEERPLDPANNAGAWEKNRRVDFFVAERDDG